MAVSIWRVHKFRLALACAAGLSTFILTALSPLPAKAQSGSATPLWNWNSFKCLGVLGGNMTNGTLVVQWACNGNPDQQWLVDVSGAWTQIRNSQNPNKCLGVNGSGTSDGSTLAIWDCVGSADQYWSLHFHSIDSRTECYNIYNFNAWLASLFPVGFPPVFPTQKVIGVPGGAWWDGVQTVLWDYQNTPDQLWCSDGEVITP